MLLIKVDEGYICFDKLN